MIVKVTVSFVPALHYGMLRKSDCHLFMRFSSVKFLLTCLQQRFKSSRIVFDLFFNMFSN